MVNRFSAGCRRLCLYIIPLLFFVSAYPSSVYAQVIDAQTVDTQAVITATPTEMTVGDVVTLHLVVTHEPHMQVVVPQLAPSWGALEVYTQSSIESQPNADGTQTTRQTIAGSLFTTGLFQTPPLPLTLYDLDGSAHEITAASISITVRSVLVDGDDTLRDIKPQAELPLPPIWPWIVGAILVALLFLGAIFWWLYRRFQAARRRKSIDKRTPAQVAFDELNRLDSIGYLASGDPRKLYQLATDCLRRYLDEQHDIPCIDRTTAEINVGLKESGLDAEHIRELGTLFTESDLVKFAKLEPEPSLAQDLIPHVRVLIEEMEAFQEG